MYRLLLRKNGFTIVELLVVVIIIAILASLVAVGYNGIQTSARDKSLLSDIDGVESELARYASKNGGVYDSSALAWNSTSGSNSNIVFTPTAGNTIIVWASAEGDSYCIKAYNPQSNSKTAGTAQTKGDCTLKWRFISGGNTYTCAIASDNNGYCWGSNTYGQLGNNSTTQSLIPIAVSTAGVLSGKTVKAISASSAHTCAIASDNNGYCWGSNTPGRLGNNSTTQSLVPVAVSTAGVLSGKTVKAISAGGGHTCAIASDDNAYCWGSNFNGELGNNSSGQSLIPVAVSTAGVLSGKTVKAINASTSYTCAIASDNNAYCWGLNFNGQLGNNSTTQSLIPIAVSTAGVLSGKTVKAISTGTAHACVIASDDNAYCWGLNTNGQLGNNSTTQSLVPVAVSTAGVLSGKTVKAISIAGNHSCVIASDNNAYCWGLDNTGQLGNNSVTQAPVPVAVSTAGVLSGKTVKAISAGGAHSCAIASDNNGYCWGYNATGQLGNNSPAQSLIPVLVTAP